eukprot:GGOE01012355.1.p1 GENE.GGOE01012355.1~~GGOE01012355.1.p1  ORF type:complete len:234 (+),score=28.89 GGOE01012355.1:1774-2475(+)
MRHHSTFLGRKDDIWRNVQRPTVKRPPLLPSQSDADKGKYTIVLDMDETLLHTAETPPTAGRHGFRIVLGDDYEAFTMLRPHATDLIESLAGQAELVLWTAGETKYAQAAMKHADPKQLINHSIYRNDAWFSFYDYKKDLGRLGRPLDRTVIVDNTDTLCRANKRNAIVIDDFFGDPRDNLLAQLIPILSGLVNSKLTVPDYLAGCCKDGQLIQWQGFYRLIAGSLFHTQSKL